MCQICAPRWRHFTFVRNIRGDGVETNEGSAEFDPASINGSDSDGPEESEVNEVSTSRGGGCGCGRKMCSGCGGYMGQGLQAQGCY